MKCCKLFVCVLIVSFIFIGCETNATAINVTMEVKPIISANGKVKFNITTNLPDSTRLGIKLLNNSNNCNAKDCINVSNGIFITQTRQFSDKNMPLKTGSYTIQITTPTANVQPKSVKSKIGANGKNLSGSLIKNNAILGRTVYFEKNITIGSN